MTTPAIPKTKPRRRWLSPRFSLQMLFLIVTVAAVGSAVWWRWPVQRTQQTKLGHHIPGINTTIYGTETTTYHRGWNGGLIQHGKRTLIYDGELYEDERFQEGIKHGPARYPHGMGYTPGLHFPSDPRTATGEYFLGKKHGTWEFIPPGWLSSAPGKRFRSIETWNRGQRHGVFEWFDEAGQSCYRHEFRNDLLVDPEKNPSENLLLKRIAAGQIQDPAIVHKIYQSTVPVDFVNTVLKRVVEDCKESYGLLLTLRPGSRMIKHQGRFLHIYDVPVSIHEVNIPVYAFFDKALRPLGLALDYRFGVLVIANASDAENWRDMTGVVDLHPSPGSVLDSALDASAKVTVFAQLVVVLQNLSRDQQIPVEFRLEQTAASASEMNPLTEWTGLPGEVMVFDRGDIPPKQPLPLTLRQLLGLLLDQANLHCHEENGVLIIEPPQKRK